MKKIHGYIMVDKQSRKIEDVYVTPNFDFDAYLKIFNAQMTEDKQLTGYLLTIVDCGDEGQED